MKETKNAPPLYAAISATVTQMTKAKWPTAEFVSADNAETEASGCRLSVGDLQGRQRSPLSGTSLLRASAMLRVASIFPRVATRVRRDGVRRSARYYLSAFKDRLHYLAYDRRWDRYKAKGTGSAVDVSESDVIGSIQPQEFRRYHTLPRLPLIWSINILGTEPVDYTFIDYGSGRGRMLLTAERIPFARIIGFSRSFHEKAQQNIAAYPVELRACRNLVSKHVNAVDFRPPPSAIVAFFFNLFPLEIVKRVASQLEVMARRSEWPSFVIFKHEAFSSVQRQTCFPPAGARRGKSAAPCAEHCARRVFCDRTRTRRCRDAHE